MEEIHQAGFHLEYNTSMEQTLGKQLKQIREEQGLSLEAISQKTRISLFYLNAIESGDVESLPSRTHMRGFLRLYANELGVNLDDLQVEKYHLSDDQPSPTPSKDSIKAESPQIDEVDQQEIHSEQAPLPAVEKETQQTSTASDTISVEEEEIPDFDYSQNSTTIFRAIGQTLRERREMLSLSLDDIHDNTHIRKENLTTIEAGHFRDLSSPVQARGMLMNYAEFLNLDVDELLLKYAEGLQIQRHEKQGQTPSKATRTGKELSEAKLRLKNFFSLDLLVITMIFIGFAFFVIWGVNRILGIDAPESAATDIPDVSEILLATGTPTPQITLAPDAETTVDEVDNGAVEEETPLFTPNISDNPINIIIIPRQRTWVQVTADEKLLFQGRLIPGNAYDFSGQEIVEILTGNAGALQIFFNDQDIGSSGFRNQVVTLTFTDTGLVLPTPTITPTVTETPVSTSSPTVTPSPTMTEEND